MCTDVGVGSCWTSLTRVPHTALVRGLLCATGSTTESVNRYVAKDEAVHKFDDYIFCC